MAPKIIGLTGSIGSGKSTVSRILEAQYGLPIIDADHLAREVVEPGQDGLLEVIKKFGDEYLLPDGSLDRAKLGSLIFSDSLAKKRLEEILHPRIRRLYLQRLSELTISSPTDTLAIIYVVPLLFESPYEYPELTARVCVYAPKEICVERIIKRNGLSEKEARRRYDSQIPMERKRELSDYVIDNSNSPENLETQVSLFVQWLKQ